MLSKAFDHIGPNENFKNLFVDNLRPEVPGKRDNYLSKISGMRTKMGCYEKVIRAMNKMYILKLTCGKILSHIGKSIWKHKVASFTLNRFISWGQRENLNARLAELFQFTWILCPHLYKGYIFWVVWGLNDLKCGIILQYVIVHVQYLIISSTTLVLHLIVTIVSVPNSYNNVLNDNLISSKWRH